MSKNKSKNLTIVVSAQNQRLTKHLPRGKSSQVFNLLLLESVKNGSIYDLLISLGEIDAAKRLHSEWSLISDEVCDFKKNIDLKNDSIQQAEQVETKQEAIATYADEVVKNTSAVVSENDQPEVKQPLKIHI